jgi:hypothetical protein
MKRLPVNKYEKKCGKLTFYQCFGPGSWAGSLSFLDRQYRYPVQIYLYESGSFHQKAKKLRKTFDFIGFVAS